MIKNTCKLDIIILFTLSIIFKYLKSLITSYGKIMKLFVFIFLKQLSTKISAYDTEIIVENIKKVVEYDIATYYNKIEADRLIKVKL